MAPTSLGKISDDVFTESDGILRVEFIGLLLIEDELSTCYEWWKTLCREPCQLRLVLATDALYGLKEDSFWT